MNTILNISYNQSDHTAIFQADAECYNEHWFQQIIRLVNDNTSSIITNPIGTIIFQWWVFISIKKEIGTILKISHVKCSFSDSAKIHLEKSSFFEKNYFDNRSVELSPTDIKNKLISGGWNWEKRTLTEHQIRNVIKLIKFPAGASFSVPGAGKTTEALAYYLLKTSYNARLLVICPKNAFISWDEQIAYCFKKSDAFFTRLRQGKENIKQQLLTDNRFFIITYQQFSRVSDLISDYLFTYSTCVFLDESHRIKSGRGKIVADSILRMSHLPVNKLILSGTPMPQSAEDLVPQYEFLYPEIRVNPQNVIERIRPIFVRTTKKELALPEVRRLKIEVPFNPIQKQLYTLMKSEVARQAESTLNASTRSSFRRLGRSVIRLIEVVSNPSLLLNDLTFLNRKLLGDVISEGSAPKLLYACERARQLAKINLKCIIWTTFRENVETIAERLSDLNAVYIHGGVDAGDNEDDTTREGRIRKFKENNKCFVLVANPAAASESISLHTVCQHAIYVDRTYNAAHYLQSEDRIHRLGLQPGQSPIIEILMCPESIDQNIHDRLTDKVARMAEALNDNSLSIETIPYDIGDFPEEDSSLIDYEDIQSLVDWLKGEYK